MAKIDVSIHQPTKIFTVENMIIGHIYKDLNNGNYWIAAFIEFNDRNYIYAVNLQTGSSSDYVATKYVEVNKATLAVE